MTAVQVEMVEAGPTRRSLCSDRARLRQDQPVDIHRGIKLAARYEATVPVAAINEWL